jgi:hypothetical protein
MQGRSHPKEIAMIAQAKPSASSPPAWHNRFLAILPAILRQARIAFCGFDPKKREDAIAEVIANTFAAYSRLVELDKEDLAYATPLAHFAIRQYRDGRRVGMKLNVRNVSSRHCQRSKDVKLMSLHRFDSDEGQWREIVVEDKRATPADIAITRIDFQAWLNALPLKKRRLANMLAKGESTREASRSFHVSPGRISQLRRELAESWDKFHSQKTAA